MHATLKLARKVFQVSCLRVLHRWQEARSMHALMALTWNLAHSPSSLSSRSSWVSGTCTSKRSNTRYLSLQADEQEIRKTVVLTELQQRLQRRSACIRLHRHAGGSNMQLNQGEWYGTAGSHDTPEWLEAPSNPGLVVCQPLLERHSFSQLLKILRCLRQHLQRRPAA